MMDGSASGMGLATSEMEAMMKKLGHNEDDLEDVVVAGDELSKEATRRMVIAHVHMDKPYS